MRQIINWHLAHSLKRLLPRLVMEGPRELKLRGSVLPPRFPRHIEFEQSPGDRQASACMSVVVAIHDAPTVTRRCLASLEKYARESEIILVDDGSKLPETLEVIRDFSARNEWKAVRHEKSLGHSEACRTGANLATGPYLCLLNSDTVVTPWCWRGIKEAFEQDQRIGVAGPSTSSSGTPQALLLATVLSSHWNDSQICSFAKHLLTDCREPFLVDLPWVGGFAFFIRRSLWEQADGFDKNLPDYGNEIELCSRIAEEGYRMVWIRNTYIHHFGQESYKDADQVVYARVGAGERYFRQRSDHRSERLMTATTARFMHKKAGQRGLTGRPNAAIGRPKAVIGHPMIGRAGSESNVMWLIEALKRDCDVTVVTTRGWDLAALNEFYGTRVRDDEVKVRIAPVPLLPGSLNASALRGACYQRFALQIAGEYDVRISAYNLTDWGLPAVHFIADFCWHRTLREKHDPPTPGFIYRDSALRRSYLRVAKAYERSSGRDVLRDDVMVANSRWTAERMREYCGVECAAVVNHPVWTEFPDVPWDEKEQAFVMIGRIVPEKRVERAIAILDALRRRGHAIRLHLCGQIGDDIYGLRIASLCREHADWIIAEGQVTGKRKAQILAGCRFGIQTREAEPFGIAVAEMVKAGAIVFAPNDGGQVEVLGHPSLSFESEPDAVEKICRVLGDAERQAELREHLRRQARLFSAEAFMAASRAVILGIPPDRGQHAYYPCVETGPVHSTPGRS
jgi:GT2 family glycosyltransferase/glycosyltransferase involved in cell wall biosynthesis